MRYVDRVDRRTDINLAVLELYIGFDSGNIHEIALPDPRFDATTTLGSVLQVHGWKSFWAGGETVGSTVEVVSQDSCQPEEYPVFYYNICVKADNSQTFCQGDTGGPVVTEDPLVLVGLTYSAVKCDQNPAKMANVWQGVTWITGIITRG